MFAADTFQGSTADRSHSWGAVPYGKPGYVPAMSHGIHDVIPFFHCCVWTEFGSDCDKYMDLRPTIDCTGYTPPTPGLSMYLTEMNTFRWIVNTIFVDVLENAFDMLLTDYDIIEKCCYFWI